MIPETIQADRGNSCHYPVLREEPELEVFIIYSCHGHSMKFEELDSETRKWMLFEFEAEENGKPYRPRSLNDTGLGKFAEIMRRAIRTGSIQSLEDDLSVGYLKSTEERTRNGKTYTVRTPANAAHRLAHTEFTTWYTRGFSRRLIEEGVEVCEVYRAEAATQPRCACSQLEGAVVSVKAVYYGHRSYHYNVRDTSDYDGPLISIPGGPLCHHTIRRVVSGK